MKLYNLYKEVILEELNSSKQLIFENSAEDAIKKCIDGMYNGRIEYLSPNDTEVKKRYIQVYVYGELKNGNKAIRAYQIGGETNTERGQWKIFLVDRIKKWEATKMKWWNPVSDYNQTIPNYNQTGDKSFSKILYQVDPSKFTRQRSDLTQRPEPIQQIPNLTNKPIEKPVKKVLKTPNKQEIKPEVKSVPKVQPVKIPKPVNEPNQELDKKVTNKK